MKGADICRAMVPFALKFRENADRGSLTLADFADGIPFAHILIDSDATSLSLDELEAGSTKWINKVSNLKKILSKITAFMETVD